MFIDHEHSFGYWILQLSLASIIVLFKCLLRFCMWLTSLRLLISLHHIVWNFENRQSHWLLKVMILVFLSSLSLPLLAGEAVQWDDRGRQGLRQRQQALREWHQGPVPAVQEGGDDISEWKWQSWAWVCASTEECLEVNFSTNHPSSVFSSTFQWFPTGIITVTQYKQYCPALRDVATCRHEM